MQTGFQTVLLLAFAPIPGALYVWAFERQAGRYGLRLQDRVLSFAGASVAYLALIACPLYWLFAKYWDRVRALEELPVLLALVPIAYLLLPVMAGIIVGKGVRRLRREKRTLAWWLLGPRRPPRAWDHLFHDPTHEVTGWVRCRLRSGYWVGGAYAAVAGRKSYASGYPEPPDLYLAARIQLDSETGEVLMGDDGQPVFTGSGLFIRGEDIEFLEIVKFEDS